MSVVGTVSSVSAAIDIINKKIGEWVSYFTFLMAAITFVVVILRYGFNLGWIAMQESIVYLHAAVFLLGSAYTLQHDGHVRVDVFYRRFSDKHKALVNLVGTLFFLLPVMLFITLVSWHYVLESWQTLEGSMESGGLPFLYVLKSFILLFSITMLLQGISEVIKQSMILAGVSK
ncbi:TRAP transporter small permease subunit [Brumicola nitratireducens]|uniref:TRAP transporter small permease protein n=1 Tax=Glaciecola nitratireducens (strain JCM 12485 / KCTC 12276 / FR1064) TaxID=1085623 RepID=G4QJ35_GLANF|nr:TRAP transporter small permease subunit [Glaciecola nitratireducens]AEP28903.1 tripartite ATP-independent periplasmic transporter, DctQ component [Glaciecola nitratireducens FR1064]